MRRKRRRPALTHAPDDRRAQELRLSGEVRCRPLTEPGPAQVAREAARVERWRELRVVRADHEVDVLVHRRKAEGFERLG